VEQIIDVDSKDMYEWPWLYAVEVGRWELSDEQAKRLRDYLDHGGFLMVDDFHGTYEWEIFMASLKKVFPDRAVVDIEASNPIFHVLYDLDQKVQVPGQQFIWSGRSYEQGRDRAEVARHLRRPRAGTGRNLPQHGSRRCLGMGRHAGIPREIRVVSVSDRHQLSRVLITH
jgi:hypothetical protein